MNHSGHEEKSKSETLRFALSDQCRERSAQFIFSERSATIKGPVFISAHSSSSSDSQVIVAQGVFFLNMPVRPVQAGNLLSPCPFDSCMSHAL